MELIALIATKARQTIHSRKKMVVAAGRQMDSQYLMLSPYQIIHLDQGILINPDNCPFVWLTDVSLKGPREDLCRNITLPIDVTSLKTFLDLASSILDTNLGPAILAWSYFYGLHFYKKWIQNLRHFNLPILYGAPTVGKTLIAQCGAWLTGCTEIHIASRCTLAFVTQWLTSSSLPFVWDDPTSPEEVAQLAIDLGNGAVRGKANEDPKSPLTACTVTANFDLTSLFKYFSRLLVMPIEPTQKQKVTGDAKKLEDSARHASAALPVVVQALSTVTLEEISTEVTNLALDADIRILEGIALSVTLARKVLTLADRLQYMPDVLLYINEQLIPYYETSLQRCHQQQQTELVHSQMGSFQEQIVGLVKDNVENSTLTKTGVAIKRDVCTAVFQAKTLRLEVHRLNGKQNHPVRLDGKTMKCITLPSTAFTSDQWDLITKIFDSEETSLMTVISTEPQAPATQSSSFTATQQSATTTQSSSATTQSSSATTQSSSATTQSSSATTQPSSVTNQPSATTTHSSSATKKPSATTIQPSSATTQPLASTSQSSSATTRPSATSTQPSSATTQSSATTTQSSATTTHPSASTTLSSATTTQPSSATTQSSSATTQPSSATTQPSSATTQPSSATTQPSSATTQPSSATTQSSSATTQPSSATTQSSSATTQPASATTQSSVTTTQPSSATTQSSVTTTQPSSATTQSSSATTQPSVSTTLSSATTTQPSSATTQPSSATTQSSVTTTQSSVTTKQSSASLSLPEPKRRCIRRDELCSSCKKAGSPKLLWISCTSCNLWYHRTCSGLSVTEYKKKTQSLDTEWECKNCV